MKKIHAPAFDALVARGTNRKQILEAFQAINGALTKFILETAQIEDEKLQREVLLRTIAQLSHQSNIAVGIAVVAGIPQAAVEQATKIGQETSAASLAHAKTKGAETLGSKP